MSSFSEVTSQLGMKHSFLSPKDPKGMERYNMHCLQFLSKWSEQRTSILSLVWQRCIFLYPNKPTTALGKRLRRLVFLLYIEMLREAYILIEINLKRTRDRILRMKTKDLPKFKVGDLVLLKNNIKQNWDARYMPHFCIWKVNNDRAYDLQDPTGHVRCATVAHGWTCKCINDLSLYAKFEVARHGFQWCEKVR